MKYLSLAMQTKVNTASIEKKTFDGFLVGVIQFLTHLAYTILLVPLFIGYWGVEKYGIWLLIFAFITIMRTIDMGHQNYVGNEFNKAFFSKREKAIEIIRSSTWVAFIIGFIELVIFGVIDELQFTGSVTGVTNLQYISQARVGIYALLIMWWLVGSVGGIIVRALPSLGYYPHVIILGIVSKVVEIIVILVATINNYSILALCLMLAGTNFIYSLYVYWHVKKLIPQIYPLWKGSNFKLGFRNFIRSILFTLSSAIEQVNSNGLVLLISNFLTITLVPAFTTLRTIANTFLQPLALLLGPLSPEITRYHMEGKGEKIAQIIYTNWLFSTLVVNLPLILLAPFIKEVYTIWTQESIIFNPTMFWLLVVWVLLANYGKPMTAYLQGINNLRASLQISVTRFILTFGISIVLLPYQGWISIGIALVISEIACSLIIPFIIVNKELKHFDSSIRAYMAALGGMPIFITMLLGVGAIIGNYVIPITLLAFISIIVIAWIQWVNLSEEVRTRMINVVRSVGR